LSVAMPGGAVWSEPRLAIKAAAAGGLDPATRQPTQVASGRLQLEAESDRFDAQLAGPVNLRDADPAWPFTLRASGSTSRWLARVRPWFTPDPWQVDGQSDVAAEVRAAANNVEVSQAKLSVANLRVVGVGWSIAEPRVEIAGDLHWNGATGELASRSAQVVSSSMSLATQDVRLQSDGKTPPQLNGVAAFRADVGRVASWKVAATQPPPYQAQGMVTGNLRFAQQAGGFVGELNATGENLSLAQSSVASRGVPAPVYQAIWQEPRVTVQGTTRYDANLDRLAFEQVQLQSNTLQAALQGQIDRLSTTADTNATGTLTYDLAQITSLLRPYTGGGVQLVGRETGRFQVAGSFANPAAHWSRTVQGRFEAPWTSADVYGLPVGAGRVAGTLGEGLVRFDPLALAVAEGRLTASPLVRLDPEPMEFTMPAGPLLTDVRISPQVSEAMLKYIAPVLAGATQSEGHFSLDLDGARVPLGDPKRADMAGKLAVHAVRVVPGPMAKQWVELAQQIEAIAKRRELAAAGQSEPISLLTIQDQQVNFRVVDGRVYHQNMQFQVGDVTLRSEGSVGLDETLALVLHVPIQDKWIEGQAFLVGLRGQSLAIPVKGTLRQPQLDRGAVAGLSQQLLQGAAQQAIGGELNKAFDKLFKPRQ
jgi:translocation and assembly module TamB